MSRIFAILFALLVQGTAMPESINPANFGAVYGKYDAATVKANDAALAQCVAKIAANGGGEIAITGSLGMSQTLVLPPTVSYNNTPGFPVHCGIRGTIDAELFKVDGGIALDWTGVKYPANLPGRDLRCSLEHIGIRNGTVRLRMPDNTQSGLGKYLTIRDVRIYGNTAGTCLDVAGYDGGHIDNVNVSNNPGCVGFSLVQCHQCSVDITSRANGSGCSITDCGALRGSLYCESNTGYGADLQGLARSSITWWLENNNGAQIEARRRNCWGNVFTGCEQADSNQAWDDDVVSRLCNYEASTLQSFPKAGEFVNLGQPGRNCWPQNPSVTVQGSQLTINTGAFDVASKAPRPCWVEMQPAGADTLGGSWNAGDVIVFYLSIKPTDSTRQWYLDNPKAQMLFTTASLNGTAPHISQRWYPAGGDTELVALGTCTAPGSNLRLFCFPAAALPGPAQSLTFNITAEVRKVVAE